MTTRRPHAVVTVCILILLAFALRVYRIDAVPLRGDEAFSMLSWTGPLKTVLRDIAPIDPQPPLAFAGLSLWVKISGSSPFSGRFYSLLWSVLTLAPLYQIGRRVGGERAGALASLLWAVNPFQVWHAQDIRAYTLWPALSALAIWLLIISVRSTKVRYRITYILATSLAAYAFYTEGFFIVFHNIYALWHLSRQPRLLRGWIVSQAAILTLLAPWYLQAPRLVSSGYGGTATQLLSIAKLSAAGLETIRVLLFGFTLPLFTIASALSLVLTIGGAIWLLTQSQARAHRTFLLGYALIPLALLLGLSTIGNFYRPRYLNAATPAYELLATGLIVGLTTTEKRPAVRWSGTLLLAGILATNAYSLANYYFDPDYAKAPNWPALTETLHSNTRQSDLVLRNVPDPAFDYYYSSTAETLILPLDANDTPIETEERLESILANTARVWFIPIEKQFWDRQNVVDAYLQSNAQLVVDTWADDLRLQRWSDWTVNDQEIAHRSGWYLGDLARLTGFDTFPVTEDGNITLHPGDSLTLIVYWEPLANSQQPYTAFTHLLGPTNLAGGQFWAGHDHPPQDGRTTTTTWLEEDLLRDSFVITVPHDAPQSAYSLVIGLYEPDSGERLAVYDESDLPQGDAVPLLNITVQP